jgi:hypothetical protein
LVRLWVHGAGLAPQATAATALAHLLTAVLIGQSLRASVLMRTLLSPTVVPARQGYKRVARAWARPWLSPAHLTPALVRAVLRLVPPGITEYRSSRHGANRLPNGIRTRQVAITSRGRLWWTRKAMCMWLTEAVVKNSVRMGGDSPRQLSTLGRQPGVARSRLERSPSQWTLKETSTSA